MTVYFGTNLRSVGGISKQGSKIQFNRPRSAMSRQSVSAPNCHVDINCGNYGKCTHCAGNPRQFENLSNDEIRYMIANSENPELMGAALKKFVKKVKKKVATAKKKVQKAVKKLPKPLRALAKVSLAVVAPTTMLTAATTAASVKAAKLATSKKERVKTANKIKAAKKKVVSNIQKLPKPLRVAAGLAIAPLMPATTASIMTTGVTVKAAKLATSKKERVKVANQIKAAKKKVVSNIQKLPKPLRIAAGLALAPLMPTTTATLLAATPIIASAKATKKITQKVQQVQAAKKAAAAEAAAESQDEQEQAVVPAAVSQQIRRGETTSAPMTTDEEGEAATAAPAEKKGGIGAMLPFAALAALIPLFMGSN
ncbi:MAG: hypothetical protein PHE88_12350 [Elusimicrobia bacterium]|nr:hypothetical protein [Elusimicrobiota bacterium]